MDIYFAVSIQIPIHEMSLLSTCAESSDTISPLAGCSAKRGLTANRTTGQGQPAGSWSLRLFDAANPSAVAFGLHAEQMGVDPLLAQ
jgi:hypothetical protein